MIKAILFGSLSSICDVTRLEREAFNRAFLQNGIGVKWTPSGYEHRLRRKGRFKGVNDDFEELGIKNLQAFYADVEHHFRDLLDEVEIEPTEWFMKAQATLRRRGFRIGLVTGAARQTTLRVLAACFTSRASLMFDQVTSFEDGKRQKPHPDLFQFAMQKMKVGPNQCCAFEVTPEGVLAANAAGLYTVAIPTPYIPDTLMRAAADTRASSVQRNIDRFYAAKLGANHREAERIAS